MGQAFEALLSALLPLLTRALPRDQNEAGGEEIRPGVFFRYVFLINGRKKWIHIKVNK